jgi:hypothetical protein
MEVLDDIEEDGRIYLQCPNDMCGWEGYYTEIVPVFPREKMRSLANRMRGLQGRVEYVFEQQGDTKKSRDMLGSDLRELEAGRLEYERLKTQPDDYIVEGKFRKTHAGSLIIMSWEPPFVNETVDEEEPSEPEAQKKAAAPVRRSQRQRRQPVAAI